MKDGALKTLFDKSSGLIVQTPKEFLRSLNIDQFTNKDIAALVKTALSEIKSGDVVQIGENSAVGVVYLIKKLNIVLKVSNLCDPSNSNSITVKLCDMVNSGSLVFKIPYTPTNETIVLVPNYISELVIGNLLEMDTKKYTSGFMKILGYYIDSESPQKSVYAFSEKLDNNKTFINTFPKFLYNLFGILHALNVAQKTGRYVHYDLHSGNIMARPTNKTSVYDLGNGNYFYSKAGFEPVIIDYGFNRYEKDGYILTPTYPFIQATQVGNAREIFDFYAYNPYYDMFTVIYTNIYKFLHNEYSMGPNFNPLSYSRYLVHIYNIMLNESFSSLEEIYKHLNQKVFLFEGWWRPRPEVLTNVKTSLCSMENLLGVIVNMISKMEKASPNPMFKLSDVFSEKLAGGSYVLYPYRNESVLDHKPFLLYDSVLKDNIESSIIQIDTLNQIPNGVRDITVNFNQGVPYRTFIKNNMIIHVAAINSELGASRGYKFNFECCRIDINDYFQNPKIQSGIAINAAFFNIRSDFSPVGTYNTPKLYIDDNEIPKEYRMFYYIVAINNEGKLVIDNLENYTKYSKFITTGPILVRQGGIIMDDQIIEEFVINGKKIFQCSPTNPNASISDCNTIKPGELSHAGNLNPRSALVTLKNSNDVLFVYVEGRSETSVGMDLSQLAQFCKWLGAHDAVNLDGGRSSQLVWKKPGKDIIYVSNPSNLIHYPVGSVISFTKEV